MTLSSFLSGRAAPTLSAQANQLWFREAQVGKATGLFTDFNKLPQCQGT